MHILPKYLEVGSKSLKMIYFSEGEIMKDLPQFINSFLSALFLRCLRRTLKALGSYSTDFYR